MTQTILVHAGVSIIHRTLDMDYMIFNVRVWTVCLRIQTDFWKKKKKKKKKKKTTTTTITSKQEEEEQSSLHLLMK